MILSLALALALAAGQPAPDDSPASCPTVLTQEAQSCRAVAASKAASPATCLIDPARPRPAIDRIVVIGDRKRHPPPTSHAAPPEAVNLK